MHVKVANFLLKRKFKANKKSVKKRSLDIYDNLISNPSENSHGHSHGNHVHIKGKDSLTSAISMIVIGDGLHNFSDGLAIGASFASSLTTGFGTSLAVLFHELPHEIGDFAVLRKNGVSVKRAVFFNIVSSVLCFVGVIVGLFIGSIEMFSQFSFLFIGGSFIYISLVDIVRTFFIKIFI